MQRSPHVNALLTIAQASVEDDSGETAATETFVVRSRSLHSAS
jgi:hypothetical protein